MDTVWDSSYKSQQGNVGLGMAIAYYTSRGVPVLIPLNDTQKYDIAIDVNGVLKRVSVKTTQGMNETKKFFVVQLKNTGGSSGKSVIRNFDNTSCDILFVLTNDGIMYEIPSENITTVAALTLTDNLSEFIVKL